MARCSASAEKQGKGEARGRGREGAQGRRRGAGAEGRGESPRSGASVASQAVFLLLRWKTCYNDLRGSVLIAVFFSWCHPTYLYNHFRAF